MLSMVAIEIALAIAPAESPNSFPAPAAAEIAPDARVLDVALACGFKTQQHFAQVFRDICGASPIEYRQDFVGSEATGACETCSEAASRITRDSQDLPPKVLLQFEIHKP
jgi:hypothetical protein